MAWRRTSGLDALVNRPVPCKWDQFIASPISFLAKLVYGWSCYNRAATAIPNGAITVVCISDTHMAKPDIPEGDILLHAGDLTQSGSQGEVQEAIDWLNTLPHQHKVVIAGNHDLFLDSSFGLSNKFLSSSGPQKSIDWGNVTYLENTSVTFVCCGRSINVFGSPWSPRHGNWAFQYPRKENVWKDIIPLGTDILLTHTPPQSHLDLSFGCKFLLEELWRLQKRPRLHVFGHIHGGHGQSIAYFDACQLQYESIAKRDASAGGLLLLVYEYFRSWFWRVPAPGTWMVNASMVGGFRDELQRKAIVLHI